MFGTKVVSAWEKRYPDIKVVAVPSELGACIMLDHSDDVIQQGLSGFVVATCARSLAQSDDMARLLDDACKQVSKPLKATECEEGAQIAPPKNRYACIRAGMCICKGSRGAGVERFRNSFHKLCLKPNAKPSSPGRALLEDRDLCVLLQPGPLDAHWLDIASAAGAANPGEVLYHIGRVRVSIWSTSWQELARAEAPPGEPAASDDRMYVQAALLVFTSLVSY